MHSMNFILVDYKGSLCWVVYVIIIMCIITGSATEI